MNHKLSLYNTLITNNKLIYTHQCIFTHSSRRSQHFHLAFVHQCFYSQAFHVRIVDLVQRISNKLKVMFVFGTLHSLNLWKSLKICFVFIKAYTILCFDCIKIMSYILYGNWITIATAFSLFFENNCMENYTGDLLCCVAQTWFVYGGNPNKQHAQMGITRTRT